MQTRRAFVQSGIAVAALAALPLRARDEFTAETSDARSLFKIVFDRTFRAGVAFGAAAARRGALVHAVGSDLGSVWMNVLEPRLRSGPVAIAGLTGAAPLFCLELLARDYGLGVVYRIEHARSGDGFRHALTGHAALADWPARLAGDANWPARAAELATTDARALAPERPVELLDLAERRGHAAESLYSWMLAPRSRRSGLRPRSSASRRDAAPTKEHGK